MLQAFRQLLLWTYWLQTKEYRYDRFEALLDSKEGWKNLELLWLFTKLITVFVAIIFGSYFFSIAIFVFLTGRFFLEASKKTLRKPTFSLRAVEILATGAAAIFATILLSYYTGTVASNLAVGEVLILVAPIVGILWTTPLVARSRKKTIKEATARLGSVRPIVVGVTGSYGKSTTKEFIAHLLEQKYRVEKTKGSQNTDFGVGRAAAVLPRGTEVFVAEVGAYKRGEIQSVASFLKPEIAVVTGIEPQHLLMFGSLENIKKAKYELVEALIPDGVAIFNYGNEHCREMASWAKSSGKKVLGYEVVKDFKDSSSADLKVRVVHALPEKVTFEFKMGKLLKTWEVALSGVHFLENLAAGILVSREMGLDWKQIQEGCQTISPLAKTMHVAKTKAKALLVDDSYNATPSAFRAAVSYISLYKKRKKIVVTSGVLELGRLTNKIHQELGEVLKSVDEVILTNSDFEKSLKAGLGERSSILSVVTKPDAIIRRLNTSLWEDSVILLEGRMPAKVNQFVERQVKS